MLNAKIEMLAEAHKQCRIEADSLEAERVALLARVTRLHERVKRLDTEANRLLREYGLEFVPDLD